MLPVPTATLARFLDLEFYKGMIRGMNVFGFARFAKIEIITRATLEANPCDWGLLAPIASNAVVNHLSVDRLSELQQRVFCGVN
jgi:hypothetical protein